MPLKVSGETNHEKHRCASRPAANFYLYESNYGSALYYSGKRQFCFNVVELFTRVDEMRNLQSLRITKLHGSLCLLLAMAAGWSTVPARAQATPKAKEPADRKAFFAAYNKDDGKELTAMRAFLKEYPKSQFAPSAQSAILDDMLKITPEDSQGIGKQADLVLKHSRKGPDRWQAEADIASKLAGTGPNGVDLPLAKKLALDAQKHLDEAKYREYNRDVYSRSKMPTPTAESLHTRFERERANVLSAVARVDVAEKDYAGAERMAGDAYAANPLDGDLCGLRGEIALQQGDKLEALDAFERAGLLGSLKEKDRPKMAELYRERHGGSDQGLEAALDAKYATLYGPVNFTPATAPAIAGGHPALLELFTGSGCPPCVGGDMAVEDLIEAYPRTAVVALVFDQHIPEPDPLANAAALDRAKLYDIHGTPSYVLDGKFLMAGGDSRDHVKEIYEPLSSDVATEAALPTAVQLKLTATRGGDGMVHAQTTVTTGDAGQLAKEIVMPPDPAPPSKTGGPAPVAAIKAAPAEPPTPHLVVNFALVENDVRYSGENGVRFHSNVVRALAKPADSGYPVEPSKTATLDAEWSPAAVSRELSAYLQSYAKEKDIQFRSTHTAIDPAHLAVAAWVQDTGTHRVLHAVIVPVTASPAAEVAAKGAR